MIGLDTNVLVRDIVQDDVEPAARAGALIEGRCTAENPGRIDAVVMCELVSVLEGAYRYSREVVAAVLRQLLGTAELSVETPHLAWMAVRASHASKGNLVPHPERSRHENFCNDRVNGGREPNA